MGLSAGQEYTVSNTREFLDALGSNRTIIVKQGEYDLSNYVTSTGASHYYRDTYDGAELVLNEIENLTIRGVGSNLTHFITRPSYGNVFVLVGCSNVKFESIKAGHGPEKGYCTGGVIYLEDCMEIEINNCLLYGSGIEGLTAEGSQDISLNNTAIQGCTYSILSLSGCTTVNFSACKFFDNEEFDMVNLNNCHEVTFKGCKFRNNRSNTDYSGQKFLNFSGTSSILFKKCNFEKNRAPYFGRDEYDAEFKKCKMSGNTWTKGKYSED